MIDIIRKVKSRPEKKKQKNVLTGGQSGDFTTKKRIGLSETVVFFSSSCYTIFNYGNGRNL